MDETLKGIIVDSLGINPDQYREDLRADEIDAWDSVMHVSLVLAIEQAFQVQFQTDDIPGMNSVERIKAALQTALSSNSPT